MLEKSISDYLELVKLFPEKFATVGGKRIITDEEKLKAYAKAHDVKLGVVYKSAYKYIVVDLMEDGERLFIYERVIQRNSGGVVAMCMCDGKFILLKQFRHTLRSLQYGFPRGHGEAGLTAKENVKKEIAEELGASIIEVIYLGNVVADSGMCGDEVSIYLCELSDYEKKFGYEGIKDVVEFTEEELITAITEGKINDGFTLSAYATYFARRKKSLN